jgi:membrane associated rhomboid family serine protease
VEDHLVYSGERLLQGVLWTPVSTLFIHSDLMHLIGNIVFLYVFGRAFEEEAGANATFAAFLVGGVASLLISSYFYGFDVYLIGASGAIFTLSAAAMLIKPLKSYILFLFIPLGLVAILYFLFNIVAIRLGFGGNLGYVTHVLGFIMGIPFGVAFSKGKWLRNLGITLSLLMIFIVVILLINSLAYLL